MTYISAETIYYRAFHHVMFSAFHDDQLEYNGSKGDNLAG